MASKDIAPVLAKEFVPLMLDIDRAQGAKAIQRRYLEKDQGIPWFVFLDGDGQALITSTGPKGNVGFPATVDEIAYFKVMLRKVKRHLPDEEIARFITSLEEANRKTTSG